MQTAAIATGAAAGILALWALVRAVRKLPTTGRQVIGAGVVEALMLVTIVLTVIAQSQGRFGGDPFVVWGYLLTALFILPVAVAWAFVDRTATSAVAMFICAFATAVMMWRVLDVAQLA
ncbi:MAG: hypothetical protein Q4G64_07895 [bacterium]|nr:hypothetical protein [bacterium]